MWTYKKAFDEAKKELEAEERKAILSLRQTNKAIEAINHVRDTQIAHFKKAAEIVAKDIKND